MAIWAQHFRRGNYDFSPPLEEEVCVIFETEAPYEDDTLTEWLESCWSALWSQYPLWVCPYSQGNPPPNKLEDWRHGFCSASLHGPPVQLEPRGTNKFYRNFRHKQ